jgi:hypothetical protein
MRRDPVERSVHCGSHQIDEAGIDHGEGVTRTAVVRTRALDVRHAGHEGAAAGDHEASRLDLDTDRTAGAAREERLRFGQHSAERRQVDARQAGPIRMRNPAAEVHSFQVGELRQQLGEEGCEAVHVGVELVDRRTAADVGVQEDDRETGALCRGFHLGGFLVPDAVLRARAAGVAGAHVPVSEPRIEAQRDRPSITCRVQIVDHSRRTDVGQHSVTKDDVRRVVAQHIGGEHHHRRARAHREAGRPGAQHLVSRHGIDPEAVPLHLLEQPPVRARLHRVTRLDAATWRDGFDLGDALAKHLGAVDVEGRADPLGDRLEIDVIEKCFWHRSVWIMYPNRSCNRTGGAPTNVERRAAQNVYSI